MSRAPREAGFTLVELLVAVAILGIVVGGLGRALIVGLKTTTATATTLVDAGDAQALSYRLMRDVKAAVALGTTGGPACAPPAPAPPQPPPTRILWTQSEDGVAAYVVKKVRADPVTGGSARSELRRLSCDAAGAPGPGPADGVVLARWPGLGDDPDVTCDGRPGFGGRTVLDAPLGLGDTNVTLLDPSRFPGAGSAPYRIVVDGEAMDVTGGFGRKTLTVARGPSPLDHAARVPVTWSPAALQTRLSPTDETVTLTDATGFPAATPPYPILVEDETMTVTGASGATLNVTRTEGDDHAAGRAVTFASCGAGAPVATARLTGDMLPADGELTLTDPTGFPVSGPPYKLVVDGETMSVTGGFGTGELTVTRPSGVRHDAQTPVSWTPDLVTVEVPRGDATGAPGGTPFRLSISRRAT